MPDATTTNLNDSQPYDTQEMVQEIAAGEMKAPKVDVAADYEAAKELSVSEIDRTEEGAKAAVAATAPQHKIPQPEESNYKAESTGEPADFLEMAREVNPLIEK